MTKVLIIGLDGATWDVMNPLIEKGKLPNIQKLMREGVYGKLRSIEPFMTPCIWTSIATGKLPEKHGAVTFYDTALQIKSKRIWDIIEESDKNIKIGLFCWPLTWPPRKINGFIIPSLFARTSDTYPPELSFINEITFGVKEKKRMSIQEKLKYMSKSLKYGIKFRTFLKIVKYTLQSKIFNMSYKEKNYKLRLLKLNIYTDFFLHLLNKYNPYFATFYLNQTDAFSHGYWKYYQPEFFPGVNDEDVKKYKNVIPLAYIDADKAIGRILKRIGDDALVILVSDHGFKSVAKYKKNRLKININILLEKLYLVDEVKYVIADAIYLFINKRFKKKKEKIINRLKSVKIKETNERLLNVSLNHLGHIVLDLSFKANNIGKFNVDLGNKTCRYSDLVTIDNFDARSGDHDINGIFIMRAPSLKENRTIDEASVLDITPTLLALLDLPIGRDMNGKILTQAIKKEFFGRHPIKYIETYETSNEKDKIETKIKKLKRLKTI